MRTHLNFYYLIQFQNNITSLMYHVPGRQFRVYIKIYIYIIVKRKILEAIVYQEHPLSGRIKKAVVGSMLQNIEIYFTVVIIMFFSKNPNFGSLKTKTLQRTGYLLRVPLDSIPKANYSDLLLSLDILKPVWV